MNPNSNFLFNKPFAAQSPVAQSNQPSVQSGANTAQEEEKTQVEFTQPQTAFRLTNEASTHEPTVNRILSTSACGSLLNSFGIRTQPAIGASSQLKQPGVRPSLVGHAMLNALLKKNMHHGSGGNHASLIGIQSAKRMPTDSNMPLPRSLGNEIRAATDKLFDSIAAKQDMMQPMPLSGSQKTWEEKDYGIATDRISKEDAISISRRLFEKLDPREFLMYGSVARGLSGDAQMEDFGDMDILTAKELYEASDVLSQVLKDLDIRYTSSKKSTFIIEFNDKKYRIELVDKSSKKAYPDGKEFKNYVFPEDVMEKTEYEFWRLKPEFIKVRGGMPTKPAFVPDTPVISLSDMLKGAKS